MSSCSRTHTRSLSLLLLLTVALIAPCEVPLLILHDGSTSDFELIYGQALEYLSRAGHGIEERVLDVTEHDETEIERHIRHSAPALILAMGDGAARLGARVATGIPILAIVESETAPTPASKAMVLVSRAFSAEHEVALIRRLFPSLRRLGLLYNPANQKDLISPIEQACTRYGLTLIAVPVPRARYLPEALDRVFGESQALWCLPDDLLFNRWTARAMLLSSFRAKVPLIGPGNNWVRSGSVMSTAWDANDLGDQCGELADQLLRGNAPELSSPLRPRNLAYTLNLETVHYMGLDIDDAAITSAIKVYQ